MSRPSPDAALDQFLEDLRRRDVATKQLTLARHFLRHLLSTLRDLPQDGIGYRKASELTLRNFPDDAQFVNLIREFFPYWSGETAAAPAPRPAAVAAPAAIASHGNLAAAESSSLDDALRRMDADPWSQTTLAQLERHIHQLKCLGRYVEELRKAGFDDANVALRLKLVKLLLYSIRDSAANTDSYRGGVDKVLMLFPRQDRWHVFVSLAREFFYFLAGDPEAPSKVQKQLGTADLQGLMAA